MCERDCHWIWPATSSSCVNIESVTDTVWQSVSAEVLNNYNNYNNNQSTMPRAISLLWGHFPAHYPHNAQQLEVNLDKMIEKIPVCKNFCLPFAFIAHPYTCNAISGSWLSVLWARSLFLLFVTMVRLTLHFQLQRFNTSFFVLCGVITILLRQVFTCHVWIVTCPHQLETNAISDWSSPAFPSSHWSRGTTTQAWTSRQARSPSFIVV